MSLVSIFVGLISIVSALVLGKSLQLHRLRRRVVGTWQSLEGYLSARYDLIAELVGLVGGPLRDQRSLLESVLPARDQAVQFLQLFQNVGGPTVTGMAPLLDAEGRLIGALQRLLAQIDRYPELLTLEGMSALRRQIETTEGEVAQARTNYNDAVISYNLAQRSFPSSWLAERGQHFPVDLYRIDQLGD